MSDNQPLLHSLHAQSISTKLVQFFILLSVSIAVGAMLSISVVHKQKQIGIIKALGLPDHDSGQIFLIQGGIIGSVGAILGMALGFIFILIFNIVGKEDIVDIRIDPLFTSISVIIAVVAALIASVFPSYTSKHMAIIDIIRRN